MRLTERPVDSALKTVLVNNEPHQYAHLIKFERPSRPDSLTGLVSTSAERYTYLTDASRNVTFDDGSTALNGTSNGPQIYLANKVLKVSDITDQVEATTSNVSLVLDGNAVGAISQETVTITSVNATTWDITWPVYEKPLNRGFREGDKVQIFNGSTTVDVNIKSFRANNVLRVTKIDTNLFTGSHNITMSLASEEILSILLDKTSDSYASFINREVFIYRAIFKNGSIIGSPILMFKGIISSSGFDDSEQGLTITWGLSSHWGDFAQVKGRVTSDTFHRALNTSGVPQIDSAIKPEYAYDKGFMHSETAINMLLTYDVQVQKQKLKKSGGFLGLGAKIKLKTYTVTEQRNTELDFQLQAKSIPLIYGVRYIDESIPVFADTLKDDPSTVFVASALCEGEIGGIYNVFVDGNSIICNDRADYDARHTQTSDNTVELVCVGRADAGQVLSPTTPATTGTEEDFYARYLAENGVDLKAFAIDIGATSLLNTFVTANTYGTNTSGAGYTGVLHNEVIKLVTPQEIELEVFTGKSDQKAASVLVEEATKNNLKIQSSYWTEPGIGGNTIISEYWGPNHRLLDTAYLLGKYKITEGETTIPQIGVVVRGKFIECYNYDNSYNHDTSMTSESPDNFPLGSYVSIYNNTGTLLVASTQIIDKWSFINPDGTTNTRFRWATPPNLSEDSNSIPSITKFYMQNGSSQRWTMLTYNHVELTGTVPNVIASPISTMSAYPSISDSATIKFDFALNTLMTIGGDPSENTPALCLINSDYSNLDEEGIVNSAILTGTLTSSSIITEYNWNKYYYSFVYSYASKLIASRNTIKLPASASASNGYYVGKTIRLTKYNSTTGKSSSQESEIIAYDGTNKIATIGTLWTTIPITGDTIEIINTFKDARVSINPVMQVLDYITSARYGRNLSVPKDIYLPSWKEAANYCDTKSDVTIKMVSTSGVTVGSVFKYPSSGNIKWQGTVKSVSGNYVTFTDCIGKITNKFNTWKSWQTGMLVYTDKMYVVTTPGSYTSDTTFEAAQSVQANSTLTKVSGSGPSVLSTDNTDGNPVRALQNGKEVSGYSLYDSDSIDYYKYVGWDEHEQRYVTKHQTNLIIDTSVPIMDNINSALQHFNGILRYPDGKYHMDVERLEEPLTVGDIRIITTDDIVGKIRLSDEGFRSSYNSVTAAFPDPSNKFEARNVSFFNSDYLKIDRNVPKKGNLSIPGIVNYYNTRLLADSYLVKSRFGLTANLTVRHHGILFLAGTVVEITYPRYGWTNKPFRIQAITYSANGLTDLVIKEYNDLFYSLDHVVRLSAAGPTLKTARLISVGSPSNLTVTSLSNGDELISQIKLDWVNNAAALETNASVVTEVYGSYSSDIFVTVDSVSAGSILNTSVPHDLVPGMPIFLTTNYGDLLKETPYYVLETNSNSNLTTSQFTISNKKVPTLSTMLSLDRLVVTLGSGLNLKIRTAELLGTVDIPKSTFIDTITSATSTRVHKYYWVRHRVQQ